MKYLVFFLLVFVLEAAPPTRESILNQLNNIIIKDITLDDLTIEEIIKILYNKSNNKVNFVYLDRSLSDPTWRPTIVTNNLGQGGIPQFPTLAPPPAAVPDPLPRIKTPRVSLKNVTLKQFLDISVLCFDQSISYVVTDSSVIFLHRNKEEKGLILRRFRIKPNIFNNGSNNGRK
jgi:hypothetical protein